MEEIIPCPVADQEVFQRVWKRVMDGRPEEDCPIQTTPKHMEGDLSCACLEKLAKRNSQTGMEPAQQARGREDGGRNGTMTAQEMAQDSTDLGLVNGQTDVGLLQEQSVPEPSGEVETEMGTEGLPEEEGNHRDNDLPHLWEEPQECSDRTARLRQQVMEALEGWQFYRHLARRTRGMNTRTLNAMAGDIHQGARKLAAAYFLLTGVRYWPSELLGMPAIPSYWGALRARHQAEQRQETAFRLAGDDWDDPSMTELYQNMAGGCQNRSRQLRDLLEQGM